jgi:hypothetical protein
MCNVPVLLIFFNRPDALKLTFEQIRLAKPKKLYLAQDGPRENNLNDNENILKCREIVENIDWDCLYSGVKTARGRKSHFEKFVKCLLDDVPNLQRISSIEEAPKGVEVIACRLGSCDFHFIRRARNGHWLHKRGGLPSIYTMTVTEVFSDNWCDGKYYGEIALFIKGAE